MHHYINVHKQRGEINVRITGVAWSFGDSEVSCRSQVLITSIDLPQFSVWGKSGKKGSQTEIFTNSVPIFGGWKSQLLHGDSYALIQYIAMHHKIIPFGAGKSFNLPRTFTLLLSDRSSSLKTALVLLFIMIGKQVDRCQKEQKRIGGNKTCRDLHY